MNKLGLSDDELFFFSIRRMNNILVKLYRRFCGEMRLCKESKVQITNPISGWGHVERRIPFIFHFVPQGCLSTNLTEEFQFMPIKSAESVDFSGDKKYCNIGNYVVK
ncbi:MAG TPA: hypothetical protein PLR45_00685 [Flavobacteriales bacterium]|nr:hypothetical protein [Flavobacteriales bacterium]